MPIVKYYTAQGCLAQGIAVLVCQMFLVSLFSYCLLVLTSILTSLDALLAKTPPNPAGITLTAPGKSFALI